MRRAFLLALALTGALAACSKSAPPVGKWEGGYVSNSTLVVARVEVTPDGQVRLMAPDITNLDLATPDRLGHFELRRTAMPDQKHRVTGLHQFAESTTVFGRLRKSFLRR